MTPRLVAIHLATTGLPKGMQVDDPAYPRMLRIGGVQWMRGEEPIGRIQEFVRQDDARTSRGAERVHGISDRLAGQMGMDERHALSWITHALRQSTHIVGWNLSFWLDVVRSGLIRHRQDPAALIRPGVIKIDLGEIMAPIVGRQDEEGRIVRPTLDEGYSLLVGQEIQGRQDCYHDALACREIFERLCERDFVPDMAGGERKVA
jgi:hypothetical protein